jgi:hypothetical protein
MLITLLAVLVLLLLVYANLPKAKGVARRHWIASLIAVTSVATSIFMASLGIFFPEVVNRVFSNYAIFLLVMAVVVLSLELIRKVILFYGS